MGWNGHSEALWFGIAESNDDTSSLNSVALTSKRWISMRDPLDNIEPMGPEVIISEILISDRFSNTDAPSPWDSGIT